MYVCMYVCNNNDNNNNHQVYMDDIKLLAKNEKRIRSLNIDSEDIQSRYRDRIWQIKMRNANHEKWKMTNEGMNRTAKSWKKSENLEKRKLRSTWEYWKWTSSNKWRWKRK